MATCSEWLHVVNGSWPLRGRNVWDELFTDIRPPDPPSPHPSPIPNRQYVFSVDNKRKTWVVWPHVRWSVKRVDMHAPQFRINFVHWWSVVSDSATIWVDTSGRWSLWGSLCLLPLNSEMALTRVICIACTFSFSFFPKWLWHEWSTSSVHSPSLSKWLWHQLSTSPVYSLSHFSRL